VRVRELKPYRGDPAPPPLALRDLDGRLHDLAAYRGQVVVLNFWASWCPPCVHEMPSMQRLQDKFAGRPLVVLAVNMGEDEATVRAFVRDTIKVTFPIPLDRDGAALKRWKVFVFPTSFVLGRDGKIRYALFGELDWAQDSVLRLLEELLTP
jgi:thiol-disulfide isomerase/thioredoxin